MKASPKIVHLASELGGGAGLAALRLHWALRKAGANLTASFPVREQLPLTDGDAFVQPIHRKHDTSTYSRSE